MSSEELTRAGLARARIRDAARRMANQYTKRRFDPEMSQLRKLERAYDGRVGPDVLILGDSVMDHVPPVDVDRRRLVYMIRDELPGQPTFHALAGPGYNPRIIMAYLAALEQASSRPQVVIVPTYPTCAMDVWLAHPRLGYQAAADEIRRALESGGRPPRRYVRPSAEIEEAYDESPAPSFGDYPRTAAELRLMTDSRPATKPQQHVRLRHLLDSYFSQRLELDGKGPLLMREMGSELARLELPCISYVAPLPHELLTSLFGPGVEEHLQHNARILKESFLAGAGEFGTVLDLTFNTPRDEFCDPVHVGEIARRRMAPIFAEAILPILSRNDGTRSKEHGDDRNSASTLR